MLHLNLLPAVSKLTEGGKNLIGFKYVVLEQSIPEILCKLCC